MNGYNLARNWYNFKFENPDICRHIHSDLYFYIIDQWNRLGQKEKFGLPTSYTMEAIGISSRKTFYSALNDLINWGFIKEIGKAKNQNASRVISIVACKLNLQALNQATIQATIQASTQASTQADAHIYKQINNKQKTINNKQYIIPTIVGLNNNLDNDKKEKEKNVYLQFVEVWYNSWGGDYVFTAKDGAKIKSLITKITVLIKRSNISPNADEIVGFWREVVQNMPDFYKGKDLSVVDSKLNEIISQIKKQNNKSTNGASKYI